MKNGAIAVVGAAAGALAPVSAILTAHDGVLVVLSRYSETISSTAILGLFMGVALMAVAIPAVVSAR
jgi:hypothetical protein